VAKLADVPDLGRRNRFCADRQIRVQQLRCPIAAASIDYALDDGSVEDEVCYWRAMTLVPHLLNLLFKREIRANYSFSPAKVRAGNRKEIARELRDEIVSMR
jgi:hypothetical protein